MSSGGAAWIGRMRVRSRDGRAKSMGNVTMTGLEIWAGAARIVPGGISSLGRNPLYTTNSRQLCGKAAERKIDRSKCRYRRGIPRHGISFRKLNMEQILIASSTYKRVALLEGVQYARAAHVEYAYPRAGLRGEKVRCCTLNWVSGP